MRLRIAFIAAALAASTLTGSGQPAVATHQVGAGFFDLAKVKAPDATGKQIYDGLKEFVADYPYRYTSTPNEILAGQSLYSEMDGLGYETEMLTLAPNQQGQEICAGPAGCPGVGLKAITATKRGTTKPNEYIMFIGHYDIAAGPLFANPITLDGAYDNGSGTNLIRWLAHEFKDVPTNRSLMFVWYNGEEQGVLASDLHAAAMRQANVNVTAVLGFDMVGIAWPVGPTATQPSGNYCLCMFHGAADGPRFKSLLEYVNFTHLGFPKANNKVTVVGNNTRNSDESSFAQQGFPTLRWAGMRTAANYPGYHRPEDTIATIESVAGGATYYEQGVENTHKSAYYTALAIDNHTPVASFSHSVSGLTVSVDGSGSSDVDGPLSSFTWDFGDGSTGEGATASHTYSAPGTYDVTLTVADNLWAGATASVTFPVTVG